MFIVSALFNLANPQRKAVFFQGPIVCKCHHCLWPWTSAILPLHLCGLIEYVVALTSLKDEIQKKRRYKAKIQRSHNYSTSIQGPPLHPLVCSEYSSPLPRVYLGLPRVYLGWKSLKILNRVGEQQGQVLGTLPFFSRLWTFLHTWRQRTNEAHPPYKEEGARSGGI